jgi:hypothetical protein
MLAWNRQYTDQAVDTSERPESFSRPRVDKDIENWGLRMARENPSWGYERIQGSLKHLGYTISDQTVGHILKCHGISPAPKRKKTVTWHPFIQSHWGVLVATGFFNNEVWRGVRLAMSCLLRFVPLSCHQVLWLSRTWHQLWLLLKAAIPCALDGVLHLYQCAYLVTAPSRARSVSKAVLEHTRSEFAFADVRPVRSQSRAQVVDL